MFAPNRNHGTDESHTIPEFQSVCRSTHSEFVQLPTRTEYTFPSLPLSMTFERLGTLLYLTRGPLCQEIDAMFLPSWKLRECQ